MVMWSTAHLGVLIPGDPPVEVRYFDSHPGRTAKEPYTTVIAHHGTGWNAKIWLPWIPHLRKDIRILAVNRRGYEGSSLPHRSIAVAATTQETFGRYLIDCLGFIKFAIEHLDVPPKDLKAQTGGIVLLGWSGGCACPIALLSLLPIVPDETHVAWRIPISLQPFQSLVNTHLRSVVLYEPPQDFVDQPETTMSEELRCLTADTLVDGFCGWLRKTVPVDKAYLLDVANDTTAFFDDFETNYGEDQSERAKVAHAAFDKVPPGVGIGVLFCTGPDASLTHIAGSSWIAAYLASQSNTMTKRIHVGNHFLMASDPETFNDAICEFVDRLRVD